ncbi:ABC transporter permease [Terrimonas alba]|uniref:ABC transporter permease n=1 Tax=Terrimonas alba TaxID=3349636 RepID=UPI0035F4F51E
MWLIKLAWKNIWRNKSRTLITMAAIFFAVILSVVTSSLQDGVFDNLIKNMVSFYSGYLQVHKKGYWDEQILDNSFEKSVKIEQKARSFKNITSVSPRLESFALASSEDITKGCLVVGISPQEENKITQLQEKLVAGNYLNTDDNSVLLSEGLAKRLQLELHDTIVLIGQGYHGATAAGKYPIKGILKFGSPDLNDKVLFMPLALAQDFYGAYGQLTSYVVSLAENNSLEATAATLRSQIGNEYEVMTWEEMMPEVVQHIRTDTASSKIYLAILYLLICFGIFGTLLVMMAERKFEIGMLVAIGMKKRKLVILLFLESVLTVVAGCLLGLLMSMPIVIYLNRHPIRFSGDMAEIYERFGFEAVFPASTEAVHFVVQGIIVLLIGLLLSLYPAVKVIRLKPVAAMRR